ncbi:hypothetical protein F4803DRAFT_405290 [Xylaria telfairii]|nr:hypothetical protein F4803DRAFT_405290 [Xylaria telfairii]
MADFYIPPKEISFRLKNKSTEKVLFSREKSPSFGQFDGDKFADQWWHLVPGTGEYDGRYLVKNNFTEKVLFSRTHKSPHVDHIDGDGKWADQWFKLEPGTGDRENWFRLKNTSSNTVVDSGDDVGNSGADDGEKDDQYWCFEFEDMKFVGIDYKVDEHKILSNAPEAIGSDTITNEDSDVDQSSTIIINQTKTVTSIHEHTHGVTVKGSFSWRIGVPVITGTNNITIEVSQNNEWKIGEHTADTKAFTVTVPVVAKPGTKVTATVTATKSELEVPYVMTWKSAKTGYQFKTEGIYRGTTYWDVQTVVKKDKLYNAEDRDLDADEDSQEQEEEEVEADVRIESIGNSAEGEERSLDDGDLQDDDEEPAPQDEGYDQARDNGEEEQYAQEEQPAEPEENDEQVEEYAQQDDVKEEGEYPETQQDEADGDYVQNNDYEQEEVEQQEEEQQEQQEEQQEEEQQEEEQQEEQEGYEQDEVPEDEEEQAQKYKHAQRYDAEEETL